jgi:hypothetical protein
MREQTTGLGESGLMCGIAISEIAGIGMIELTGDFTI